MASQEIIDDFSVLTGSAPTVAKRLLGSILVRKIGDVVIRVRIVETEAYDETDVASHSYRGQTERTKVMFGPPGFSYVYFTYGMHYCCNIVVGAEGFGAAVLIRAVEPIEGESSMMQYRAKTGIELSNGPAKLCQALCIDKALNAHDLHGEPLQLEIGDPVDPADIITTTRIGIREDAQAPWRYYIKDNPYVSVQARL